MNKIILSAAFALTAILGTSCQSQKKLDLSDVEVLDPSESSYGRKEIKAPQNEEVLAKIEEIEKFQRGIGREGGIAEEQRVQTGGYMTMQDEINARIQWMNSLDMGPSGSAYAAQARSTYINPYGNIR